jgi:hypothetical protein
MSILLGFLSVMFGASVGFLAAALMAGGKDTE